MNQLRYYQRAAIDSVSDHLQNKGTNPCIVIPTGGGKSPVIARLAGDLVREGNRVLIIAHRKELLGQTADKLSKWESDIKFSIYSAGLKKKDLSGNIVVAGIQSIFKEGVKLSSFGNIDFVIIDECHLIPASEERSKGMFRSLLDELYKCNPDLTVIGFTATPYRMGSGMICGKKNILNEICYDISINELISKGYLTPLISKQDKFSIDFSKVKISKGEFDLDESSKIMSEKSNISRAVDEILLYGQNRRKCLIFCISINHAQRVEQVLKSRTNEGIGLVTGNMNINDRDHIINRFIGSYEPNLFGEYEEDIKYLLNVEILTTGFDFPEIDFLVLLRPTMSPGLYYQMVGRGFRIAKNKKDCLILDYGGNILRHGPVDRIHLPESKKRRNVNKSEEKAKVCPKCNSILQINADQCDCGFIFEDQEDKNYFLCPLCKNKNRIGSSFCSVCGYKFPVIFNHEGEADNSPILSKLENSYFFEVEVKEVRFFIHNKKCSPKDPKMLWAIYTAMNGDNISEFIHFGADSGSWKRNKAIEWWKKRSKIIPIPKSAEDALMIIDLGLAAKPISIKYRPGNLINKYNQFEDVILGEIPLPINNIFNLCCDRCIDYGIPNDPKYHYFIYQLLEDEECEIKCARCGHIGYHGNYENLKKCGCSDFNLLKWIPAQSNYDSDLDF